MIADKRFGVREEVYFMIFIKQKELSYKDAKLEKLETY